MKATVVGLVTPHVLRVIDLAREAETGVNVDWHLRDAVAKSADELGHQFNAPDLFAAYISCLETAARDAGPTRKAYASALRASADMAIAARNLRERG